MKELSDEVCSAFNMLDDQSLSGRFSADNHFKLYDSSISEQMQKVDSFLWDMVLNESGIFNITSQDLKDKLKDKYNYYSIEGKRKTLDNGEYDITVPVFTVNAVNEVIDGIVKNLPSVRTATLREVFNKLNKALYIRDRNNRESWDQQSKLKIEKKMRFNYFQDLTKDRMPSIYSWSYDYRPYGNPRLFGDLENAFRMIDGQTNLKIEDRICTKMISEFTQAKYESTNFPMKFSNEYFEVQCYKKGTVLLTFHKEKLKVLDQFNKYSTNGSNLA